MNASALVVGGSDLGSRVRELKSTTGGDIVLWGGAKSVQQPAAAGVIDEFQLIVQPVALGAGVDQFANEADRSQLRLLEARRFESGAVYLQYAPRRDGSP